MNRYFLFSSLIHILIFFAFARQSFVPKSSSVEFIVTSEVSLEPEWEVMPKIFYPEIAEKRGIEGVVELKVEYSSSGTIESAEIIKSSGNEILDNDALVSIFNGKVDSRGLEGSTNIKIEYKLR